MDTKFTVCIRFGLIVRIKFSGQKRLGIILGGISSNRCRVQPDKGSIQNSLVGKKEYLGLHDTGKDGVVEVFEETIKSPVRRKRLCNVKTAVMCDEKVIVEIINKIGDHGKAFTFHDNKRTDQGMIRKAFPSAGRILRNGRQIQIQKEGVVKSGGGLGSKEADIVNDFLTIDNNQLLSGELMLTT